MPVFFTLFDPAALMFLAQANTSGGRRVIEIGVIVTALLGLLNLGYNLRHHRRASYVGAVTAARLKWIDELRNNLSRFAALVYQYSFHPPSTPGDLDKVVQEIAHLRVLLKLQLVPRGFLPDSLIEDQVEAIFQKAFSGNSQQLEDDLKDLVVNGQDLLWKEWRKAKSEAIYGDPYDTWTYRYKVWLERMDSQLE